MTEPMFFITSRTDSGIDIPDLDVNDEKFLGKYGSDLTANFADIRVYGSKAFVQKRNTSNGSLYSISTCATGYIWVSTTLMYETIDQAKFSDIELHGLSLKYF